MVVGRVIMIATVVVITVTIAICTIVTKMTTIEVAGAVVLVTALIGVYGRVGDTVSPLRPAPLCLLPLLYLTKNFTANNSQQTHYQHEHTNETLERYLYSYD